MNNVLKWSNTLWQSCSKSCNIFKVYHFETLCIKGIRMFYKLLTNARKFFMKKYLYNTPLSISVRIVRITVNFCKNSIIKKMMAKNLRLKIKKKIGWGRGSAIKKGSLYKLFYLSFISQHFKIFFKGGSQILYERKLWI